MVQDAIEEEGKVSQDGGQCIHDERAPGSSHRGGYLSAPRGDEGCQRGWHGFSVDQHVLQFHGHGTWRGQGASTRDAVEDAQELVGWTWQAKEAAAACAWPAAFQAAAAEDRGAGAGAGTARSTGAAGMELRQDTLAQSHTWHATCPFPGADRAHHAHGRG